MQIFTQPNAAITGGSCLEGGNRRRRVQPEETPAEPTEKVDFGSQVSTAIETATKLAQQTGTEVSVEVGGVKVTIKPKPANAPTSIAQIDEPAAEPQVRPEVGQFLSELKEGTITGVRHTTRGMQPTKPFQPQAPKPFGAGRFAVEFRTKEGEDRGFIVQTEAKVGHLAQVIPGQTDIGGHIAILSDPTNDRSESITLTRDEQDAMLASLYGKAGQQMTEKTADATNFAISTVAAVRFSGEGAEAVSRAHARYA